MSNGLGKPPHVFGRDREWGALADFAADPRQEVTLGIVSGRRRQGKTYLLRSLAAATGGFFFEAAEATEAESLRMFGAALARQAGSPADFSFPDWENALRYFADLAGRDPVPLIIDEFSYLVKASPALPSLLRREIDSHGPSQGGGSRARILLCGSAMSVMGGLLAGNAPLRGRAGLEMVIKPFGYRDAARFWGVSDPGLAVRLHAIVGGTPAYRRQFVRDDAPAGPDDFGDWVVRSVLNPDRPLLREARYLLAEETDIRDPALYHSVLAAIAARNETWGGIANYIGRKASDIAHPLNVLEDAGLVVKETDVFRAGRTRYRITEPLVTFYERSCGPGGPTWNSGWVPRYGPTAGRRSGRRWPARISRRCAGSSPGPRDGASSARPWGRWPRDRRRSGEQDADRDRRGRPRPGPARRAAADDLARRGEVGQGMSLRHVERLRRARALLAIKGYDTTATTLACYSGAGFEPALQEAARSGEVMLVGLDRLYQP